MQERKNAAGTHCYQVGGDDDSMESSQAVGRRNNYAAERSLQVTSWISAGGGGQDGPQVVTTVSRQLPPSFDLANPQTSPKMASISAGTRNLKFMQRGTQLPPNPTPSGTSRATTSSTPAAPSSQTATSAAKATAATQEEEEQWVLPTRQRSSAKGKGKPTIDRSSTRNTTQPRVVVTSESSYLAFVGPGSFAGGERDHSSDDDMHGGGVMSNGRLTFGTLPSKETVSILFQQSKYAALEAFLLMPFIQLDTSIVDNREKMSHAKATTTASDRFAVFSTPNGEASSSRRKGRGEDDSTRRDERRTRDPEKTREAASTTDKAASTSTRQTKQRFIRPSNFDDIPHPSRTQPTAQDAPSASSSKRNGKKRKSDQLTGEGDEQGEVLVQGARARGKRSKKQVKEDSRSLGKAEVKKEGKSKSRDLDQDAMAAEIAGGAMDDEEVERYLEDMMQEMRND